MKMLTSWVVHFHSSTSKNKIYSFEVFVTGPSFGSKCKFQHSTCATISKLQHLFYYTALIPLAIQ